MKLLKTTYNKISRIRKHTMLEYLNNLNHYKLKRHKRLVKKSFMISFTLMMLKSLNNLKFFSSKLTTDDELNNATIKRMEKMNLLKTNNNDTLLQKV